MRLKQPAVLGCLLALLYAIPVHSATTIIDFEAIPSDQARVDSPFVEDGFIVELVPDPRCTFPTLRFSAAAYPDAENMALGGPMIMGDPPECSERVYRPVKVVVRRPYNEPFDVRVIDFASWMVGLESVSLRGIRSDGQIVEQTCTAPSDRFETCVLDTGFSGLVRLEWPDGSRATVVLTDNIVLESGAPSPAPWAEISPRAVDFGPVVVGGENAVKVSITNKGTAPLNITSIASTDPLAAPFSITQNACMGRSLQTGRQCAFTVRFVPTGVGEYSDTFRIVSNDPYAPSIRVNVSGVAVTVGGQVIGLNRLSVTCENRTKKAQVTFPVGAGETGIWDCQVAGLPVSSGDDIQIKVKGIAE